MRVVAGLVLIGLAIVGSIGVWGYIGILPLATGAFGVLPGLPPARLQHLPGRTAPVSRRGSMNPWIPLVALGVAAAAIGFVLWVTWVTLD